MNVQEKQRYLTAGDVTRMLRIDKSTVYRMAEDGRLPGFKVGRQWRFRADDVASVLGIGIESPPATFPIDLGRAESLSLLFADLYGLMVVVTDLDGRPLIDVINKTDYFETLSADPTVINACATEWRGYAEDYDFAPAFRESHLGFLCARAFIRDGFELVGMVIAGGIAPIGWPDDARIAEVARRHDIDAETLLAAADKMLTLEKSRQSEALSALSLLARHISSDQTPRSTT